jgi:hypothetical protein
MSSQFVQSNKTTDKRTMRRIIYWQISIPLRLPISLIVCTHIVSMNKRKTCQWNEVQPISCTNMRPLSLSHEILQSKWQRNQRKFTNWPGCNVERLIYFYFHKVAAVSVFAIMIHEFTVSFRLIYNLDKLRPDLTLFYCSLIRIDKVNAPARLLLVNYYKL